MCWALMMVDHVPMPMGQTGTEAVAIVDWPRQPFDGLNTHIARVAITYKIRSISYYLLRLVARAFAVFSAGT